MGTGYQEIYQAIRQARLPVLVAHLCPDGDTLGSVLAMSLHLEDLGAPHFCFCRDKVPRELAYLPGAERVQNDESLFVKNSPDLVVVFDSGDLRIAGLDEIAKNLKLPNIINIDHHASNERYGQLNLVDSAASSTSEIVYNLFTALKVPTSREMATCLFTGVSFDTSLFSNAATSVAALEVGAELLRRGAKFNVIFQNLFKKNSVTLLILWGLALSRIAPNPRYGIATTVITQDDLALLGADEEMTSGITNFLNKVLDVPTVLLLVEMPNGLIKGSFRTTSDADVSKIAKAFGGGGHKKAAGFTIKGRLVNENGNWKVEST